MKYFISSKGPYSKKFLKMGLICSFNHKITVIRFDDNYADAKN